MEQTKRSRTKRFWASSIALLALATVVHAEPFDAKSQVPRATTPQALRTRLESHFATYQRMQQAADPAAFIRDRQAYQQWADLFFAVTLAFDERMSVGDLSAFGLSAQPDGTYTVDLRKFPQWDPLDARLYRLGNPAVLESYVPALKERGFRDADIVALRTYLATHDPRLRIHAAGRELVDTFAKQLQERRKAGKPLNLDQVLMYRYQKESLKAECDRQWAVALMDALDPQRQRILASFLDEFESTLQLGGPAESLDRSLAAEAEPIVSGEYVQRLNFEEAQLRQDVEQRARKLTEGEQR
ncbi:MAG TPA: hypothetical protein VH814_04960 [Steroidobacteraceae bacterium]|jgi:hypothetical protein